LIIDLDKTSVFNEWFTDYNSDMAQWHSFSVVFFKQFNGSSDFDEYLWVGKMKAQFVYLDSLF